jgi:putative SOS response-associated peptidase YedK
MCNRYIIKGTTKEISEHFQATLPALFDVPTDDILPGHIAPGLILNRDGDRELVPMQFGLAKLGAYEPFDRKWPNNNARIEKHDAWPWKIPFKEHRCILPLSLFREPCYWGETAGSEVYFKAQGGDYLGVAGLFNIWKAQGAEKFYSMTFLMRSASKYVMDRGHHRQPFFIEERSYDSWMKPGERDPKESLAILREFAYERPFEYHVARQMAASWKSRQKGRLADRDEQLAAIEETGRLGI